MEQDFITKAKEKHKALKNADNFESAVMALCDNDYAILRRRLSELK